MSADGSQREAMWQVRGPDGTIAPGWYLAPLRLFLGATFLFAGLQKLANPGFFRASDPTSIHAQLMGATRTSPIGGLLHHLVGVSTLIGASIAVAEVAIGVGALLGLLTRVAAVGGMVVSFSLFLTVSFHSHPYFTGSDIVFVFAWTPLLLAGAGGAPALDTWRADRRVVPAAASSGEAREGTMSRGTVIGAVVAGTAVLIGAVVGLGRAFAPSAAATETTLGGGSPTSTTSTSNPTATTAPGATTSTTAAVPKGTSIGPASGVPVGGSAAFNDPTTGDPALVIQKTADEFNAFDAICPHAGCTVAYQARAGLIVCPCHGSEYNPGTGAVIQGPATSGLTRIKVVKGSNGNLYVT